jgi:hypothetical protein
VTVVVVVAEAVVSYSDAWWKMRDRIYKAIYPTVKAKVDEVLGSRADELLPSALDLLDRMLPAVPLQAPAIPNAEALFAAPVQS